jgi:hypothetical protein
MDLSILDDKDDIDGLWVSLMIASIRNRRNYQLVLNSHPKSVEIMVDFKYFKRGFHRRF